MSATKLNSIISNPNLREKLEKRFWSKVDRRGPDECWPWTAKARHKHGYGMLSVATGFVDYSHRVAFALTNGAIGESAHIRHSCDYPPCCNGAHLLEGTPADNVADMMNRGRHVKRPDTPEIRQKIRDARAKNPPKQSAAVRAKKSEEMKRRWQSAEWRAHFSALQSGENNPHFGKKRPRPPGVTAKIVASRKANGYRHSPGTKEKMRLAAIGRPSAKKGKKLSEDTKARMREAAARRYAKPQI